VLLGDIYSADSHTCPNHINLRPQVLACDMNNRQAWAYNSPSPYPRSMYQQSSEDSSAVTRVTTTIALLVLGYYALKFFELWPSTLKRRAFETFVDFFPAQLIILMQSIMIRLGLLGRDTARLKFEDLTSRHAKSDILRELLGFENNRITSAVRKARTFSGIDNILPPSTEIGPAGLGNWDNSCYQNSVLHGFASLPAFNTFVSKSWDLMRQRNTPSPTHEALVEFLGKLNAPDQPKRTLWTPAVLKSMDSWQQQDAQEYFSRVLDAVEKEDVRFYKLCKPRDGLEKLTATEQRIETDNDDVLSTVEQGEDAASRPSDLLLEAKGLDAQDDKTAGLPERNPLDGMLAQSLKCRACGFSEGLSLTQFNCITVNLGTAGGSCTLEELLDEYTVPEDIDGVECIQCTKLASSEREPVMDETASERPTDASADATKSSERSTETQNQCTDEKPTRKKPKQVLSTKSKQLTIGRLPEDLVIHLNRSIFDMYGNQRKNTAVVDFPLELRILNRWCAPLYDLDGRTVQATYTLRCVVTHAGRHDDGHYIAYAKREKDWYCFNDEVVTKVSEEFVFNRGNAFMLFYEVEPASMLAEDVRTPTGVTEVISEVGLSGEAGTEAIMTESTSLDVGVVNGTAEAQRSAKASISTLTSPQDLQEDERHHEADTTTTPSSATASETEIESTSHPESRPETKFPPMRTASESSSIHQCMESSHAAPVF
jgi:ubiquitin carboxyl-terminal hydrolase 1